MGMVKLPNRASHQPLRLPMQNGFSLFNPDRTLQPKQLQRCCLHRGQSQCSCPLAGLQRSPTRLPQSERGRCSECRDLIAGDNPAQYRGLPVIIGSNQCSGPVVQFQSRISQCVGDPILRELGANGTNDHSLWPSTLDNKTTNHHMLARLNKAAGADVTKA